MIKIVGIKNIIPDKEKIEDAVNVYYKFYTAKQEKEFRVLGIFLERVKE